MRVLVDTHALFWWVTDDDELSARARDVIADEDNEILVSAAVAWELATKVRFFKWPEAVDLAMNIEGVISANDFTPFPVTVAHARVAGLLPGRHRDPFDRILAAQSQVEAMPLLSADPIFATLAVPVIW
jgi:PIN domain nuclease of toxin-antitoxin system